MTSMTGNALESAPDNVSPPSDYVLTFRFPSFSRNQWTQHFDVANFMIPFRIEIHDLVVLPKSPQVRIGNLTRDATFAGSRSQPGAFPCHQLRATRRRSRR